MSSAGNAGDDGTLPGAERGEWRKSDFVQHLFDYLVMFALKWSQLQRLNSATAYRMIEDAARRVYESENYGKRGEFGELLLHGRVPPGPLPAVRRGRARQLPL